MNNRNDGLPVRVQRGGRDLSHLTLGELLVVGNELRRRSKAIFADMVALEAQLQKHLPHYRGMRPPGPS